MLKITGKLIKPVIYGILYFTRISLDLVSFLNLVLFLSRVLRSLVMTYSTFKQHRKVFCIFRKNEKPEKFFSLVFVNGHFFKIFSYRNYNFLNFSCAQLSEVKKCFPCT